MSDLFPETLLVAVTHGHTFTTSRAIAEHFGKRHDHVLRDIEALLIELAEIEAEDAGLPISGESSPRESEFGRLNFEPISYLNEQGKKQPMYRITEEGFAILAMGYKGRKALRWKTKFLAAFRAMEAQLRAHTDREAAALNRIRPLLRPVIEGTAAGLKRRAIGEAIHRSPASVTYHRRAARQLGLLAA